MITRKLNELQINKVLEHINSHTLESLSISVNKRGVHMINYDCSTATSHSTVKSSLTVELVRIIREIQRQVCSNSYDTIKLEYSREESKLLYQLELKEQG